MTELMRETVALDHVQDLGVILFSGSNLVSKFIRFMTSVVYPVPISQKYGTWSHAGVVVSTKTCVIEKAQEGVLYVLEITMSGNLAGDGAVDVESSKPKFGVQIRKLEDLIKTYGGRMAFLNLANNPSSRASGETEDAYSKRMLSLREVITKFKRDHIDDIYQLNIPRLSTSLFRFLRSYRRYLPGTRFVMCSELCASLYRTLGIFPEVSDPENFIPQDALHDVDGEVPDGLFLLPPLMLKIR